MYRQSALLCAVETTPQQNPVADRITMASHVWPQDDELPNARQHDGTESDEMVSGTRVDKPRFALVVGSLDDDESEEEFTDDETKRRHETEDTDVGKSARLHFEPRESRQADPRQKSPDSWPFGSPGKNGGNYRGGQSTRGTGRRDTVSSPVPFPELGAAARPATPAPPTQTHRTGGQDEISVFELSGGALSEKVQQLADTLIVGSMGNSLQAAAPVLAASPIFAPFSSAAATLNRLLSVAECAAHFVNATCDHPAMVCEAVSPQEMEKLVDQSQTSVKRARSQMLYVLQSPEMAPFEARFRQVNKEEAAFFETLQSLNGKAPREIFRLIGLMDAELQVLGQVAKTKLGNLERSSVVETQKANSMLEDRHKQEAEFKTSLCAKWKQLLEVHNYLAVVENVLQVMADDQTCAAVHDKARGCLVLLQDDTQSGECEKGLQFLAENIRCVRDAVKELRECVSAANVHGDWTVDQLNAKEKETEELAAEIRKETETLQAEMEELESAQIDPQAGEAWAQNTVRKSRLKTQLANLAVNMQALQTTRSQVHVALKLRRVHSVFAILENMDESVAAFLNLVNRTEATLQRREFILQVKLSMIAQIAALKSQDVEKTRLRTQRQVVERHAKQVAETYGQFLHVRQNIVQQMHDKRAANLVYLESDNIPSSVLGKFRTYFKEYCDAHDKFLKAVALLIQSDMLARATESCKKVTEVGTRS